MEPMTTLFVVTVVVLAAVTCLELTGNGVFALRKSDAATAEAPEKE